MIFATVYKQDSIGWKIELFTQRIQERWEVFTSGLADRTPDIPQWNLNLNEELIKLLIKGLLWTIIAVIVVWLAWQLWLLLRPYWIQWRKPRQKLGNSLNTESEIKLSVNEWLERSQLFQKQRDYRQAIFCLYQATIQELSDRKIIDFSVSLTDREYLKLIKNLQLVESQSYELLLNTHEKLCFSQQDASHSLWEKCQQAYYSKREK